MVDNVLVEFHMLSEFRHLLKHSTWSAMLILGVRFMNLNPAKFVRWIEYITFGVVAMDIYIRNKLQLSVLLIRLVGAICLFLLAVICYSFSYSKYLRKLVQREGFNVEKYRNSREPIDRSLTFAEEYFFWVICLSIFRTFLFMVKLFVELGERFIIHFRLNQRFELLRRILRYAISIFQHQPPIVDA